MLRWVCTLKGHQGWEKVSHVADEQRHEQMERMPYAGWNWSDVTDGDTRSHCVREFASYHRICLVVIPLPLGSQNLYNAALLLQFTVESMHHAFVPVTRPDSNQSTQSKCRTEENNCPKMWITKLKITIILDFCLMYIFHFLAISMIFQHNLQMVT